MPPRVTSACLIVPPTGTVCSTCYYCLPPTERESVCQAPANQTDSENQSGVFKRTHRHKRERWWCTRRPLRLFQEYCFGQNVSALLKHANQRANVRTLRTVPLQDERRQALAKRPRIEHAVVVVAAVYLHLQRLQITVSFSCYIIITSPTLQIA